MAGTAVIHLWDVFVSAYSPNSAAKHPRSSTFGCTPGENIHLLFIARLNEWMQKASGGFPKSV